jgi:hypothetical protein
MFLYVATYYYEWGHLQPVGWTFQVNNSLVQLVFTCNHDFAEYECYQQQKFVFSKDQDCGAYWYIETPYSLLMVPSITTNSSDFYIRSK